ncbi:GH25 family lysozyme [Pedosphaera parvula]|uniref:Glycoside hydrolase family 25 n=1 Tax=Pedosphaera parvula (strain Ellin514) TaxID=320771 RepID=B9XSL5_PEDPL|nr:GH25 family lysozyme [Pedosphaera parvula]EEF57175.1 glycoside hydrolase family 25 [Pedosphaera parvula Ellin514]
MKKSLKPVAASTPPRLALIASALGLILAPGLAQAQRPLGIDVSSYQGSGVNWSGISFGWAKATEGTYFIDGDFVINENNAKAAGTLIGAYHFARPDLDSPGAEASYFWNQAGGYIKNDGKSAMPALDFETFNGVVGAGSYSAWANAWCDAIVNNANGNGVKVRPVLYCSTCQACNFDGSVGQWIPWIANPSGESAQSGSPWGSTPCPSCGSGIWGSGAWDFWQYGGSSIDLDVFNGTTSDMIATLGIGSGGTSQTSYSAFVGPIIANSDGRLEMFGVGANSDIWHNYQSAPNSGWNGWIDMANGNSIAGPAVGRDKDGRLELFASTGSGKVWHNFQTIGGGGAWNGWGNQAGPSVTNLVALSNADGRLEVFGIGNNGDVWHEWQTAVNGAWTTSWSDITGQQIKAGMVGIANKDGRLEIFGQGQNGHVWHNWQTSPGQVFNGWADMGSASAGLNSHLAIAKNADGTLELFGVDSGGNVWHNYQTTPGGAWNGFIGFGGQSGIQPGFAVGINPDGRLEMFGVGSNGNTYHVWQDQPGSRWHSWSNLGGSSEPAITLGNNKNGELQVFVIGTGTKDVWSIYQSSPGGSWGSWFDLGGNGTKFFYGQ